MRRHEKRSQYSSPYFGLFKIICDGDLALLKKELKAGIAVNATQGANNHSPLHTVALFDRPNMVAPLIKQGANIEAKDNLGNTPLILACMYGSLGVALRLLDYKPIINPNNRGALVYIQRHNGHALYKTVLKKAEALAKQQASTNPNPQAKGSDQ